MPSSVRYVFQQPLMSPHALINESKYAAYLQDTPELECNLFTLRLACLLALSGAYPPGVFLSWWLFQPPS
jgi:hypothetical protein